MFKCFALLFVFFGVQAQQWYQKKLSHVPYDLSDAEIHYLAGLSNETAFNDTLEPILIPRIPSTKGHDSVKKYIISTMESLQWDVKTDSFVDQTPVGELPFTNIIATLDPMAPRHLVLACHYDSKMDREKALVLATDSAVPCAMMLHLAKILQPVLRQPRTQASDVSLQLIFFDGEEAFLRWSSTDSLYGSRHLARMLQNTAYPDRNQENTNYLHRMDVMVLLDLIGYRNPSFYNFFSDTSDLFVRFVNIESRLHSMNLLTNHRKPYFYNKSTFAFVEDDHIPFMEKGVRIVHLIPHPFPPVWHSEADTKENLDFDTIANLNTILRVYVAEYLHFPLTKDPL